MAVAEDLEPPSRVEALLADMTDILYFDHNLGTGQVQELMEHQPVNRLQDGVAFDGLDQVEAYIEHNHQ